MANANVANVRSKGGNVVVAFEDGHSVIFVPNSNGWNSPDPVCNEEIRLVHKGELVVTFFSPRQRPVNKEGEGSSKFGFQPTEATSYTLERISEYFGDAYAHIAHRFGTEGKLGDEWNTVYRSSYDIQAIALGEHSLP